MYCHYKPDSSNFESLIQMEIVLMKNTPTHDSQQLALISGMKTRFNHGNVWTISSSDSGECARRTVQFVQVFVLQSVCAHHNKLKWFEELHSEYEFINSVKMHNFKQIKACIQLGSSNEHK